MVKTAKILIEIASKITTAVILKLANFILHILALAYDKLARSKTFHQNLRAGSTSRIGNGRHESPSVDAASVEEDLVDALPVQTGQ